MELVEKSKRDTRRIGDISETAIMMRFLQLGYTVLTPYGGNQRYDLVVENTEEQIWRIQCKTARFDKNNTVLTFHTSIRNVTGKNRQSRHYRGQCDYFAVYNAELAKVYLISVNEVGFERANFRLIPPKNKNQHGYRMASDYEL